jgi:hypothetical protein
VVTTRADLEAAGFSGFVQFGELPASNVPRGPGVYAAVRTSTAPPAFRAVSPAGWFKDRDPSASREVLEAAWVRGVEVVYIGKATPGKDAARGLHDRLSEYRRHGAGRRAGHWGGRYIWLLEDSEQLLVAWLEVPMPRDAGDVEAELIAAFRERTGEIPFANLTRGRRLPES